MQIRRALISVWDKTGIVEFARALHAEFGIEIISTGGTAKALTDAGIPVTLVETLTGCGEMLDGRVKTLHPAIHAAILADRDNAEHMRQLDAAGIKPIDMVVVNLYPFEKTVADPNCTFEQAIEMIDIGGVALLRAAAKNHKHVAVVTDSDYFRSILADQRGNRNVPETSYKEWCREQAFLALWKTARYDALISKWLGRRMGNYSLKAETLRLETDKPPLRYGENPHQHSELLENEDPRPLAEVGPASAYKLAQLSSILDSGGTGSLREGPALPISYNNLVDAEAALGLCAELTRADLRRVGERPQTLVSSELPEKSANEKDATREVWNRAMPGESGDCREGQLGGDAPTSEQPQAGSTEIHRPLAGSTPVNEADTTKRGTKQATQLAPTQAPRQASLQAPAQAPLPNQTSKKPVSADRLRPISDEVAYRRNLPHLQRPGASYFLTFRTAKGQGNLSPAERDIVMDCCLIPDREKYCLHAAVCMPDHVHLLATPLEASPGSWHSLAEIMLAVKGNIGRLVAEHRGRPGAVLQDESFDHIIRNATELMETIEYIRTNPARARLAAESGYPWLVLETEPEWDPSTRAAGVDLRHELWSPQLGTRGWHGRLAGNTEIRGTVQPEVVNREVSTNEVWNRAMTGESGDCREGQPGVDASHFRQSQAGSTEIHRALPGSTLPKATVPVSTRARRAQPACVCFIKHTNACGVGVATDALDAYRQAYLGDPNAAMGGILACNFDVDASFAAAVMETYDRLGKPLKEVGAAFAPGGFFVEVWLAPAFDDDAVAIIRGTYDPEKDRSAGRETVVLNPPKKKWGENVRLLAVGDMSVPPDPDEMQYRSIGGGMLVQSPDLLGLNEEQWKVATKRSPSEAEMADLRLAWLICKHTKSNAITLVKDGMLIGNGAGQMSRVMSCRIATWLARENGHAEKLSGSVAASDAFFPFADGPRILIDAGVRAIIQPGGSKRDEETIALCDERNVAMIFTGTRHFRH